MSSDVNLGGNRSNVIRAGTTPRRAAWLDAGASAYRQAARRLSSWSEAGARYFRQRRAEDIAADVRAFARARPGQTLAVAALLGVLVGGAIHRFRRR